MHNSIKSISIEQLQTAFAKTLAELTGKDCIIKISGLQFTQENQMAPEKVAISLDIAEKAEPQPTKMPWEN
ncbi:hypothetical protein [Janthinobacterium psychrotolerans]|uniref:hypothetical protein n=1 Tax=Janthinobacterium psychrotolerans TaxID=1747903 RepID=UPI0012371C67|nr:hypothetical protein [Janthinobacterium psychrotolerans]